MNFTVPYDRQLAGLPRSPTKSSPHAPRGRSKLSQGNGLCISIDLGTTHSAVAFGTSASPTASQIYYWPGSSHPFPKIPTCVVYDGLGDVRAWGVEAKETTLRKGWVRSEWFKLGLDPSFATNGVHTMLPVQLAPPLPKDSATNVLFNYLSSLWLYAKGQIMQKNTLGDLNVANVYLTVPSSWDARKCLILREAAIKAGLVAQITSQDTSWMDRLHIIAEPEASAVYCVSSPKIININKLEEGQQLMVCNAGGVFVDMAVYNVLRLWGTAEISESCLRSGRNCGSLFLDLRFRDLVCSRLAGHPSHLDEASLAHFLLSFEMEKKNFHGPVDDNKYYHFRCLRPEDLHDPAVGLENGELILPGFILRRDVFDPVITQVLQAIQEQLEIFNKRVDILVLMGGFASSDYLFRQVKDEFGSQIHLISRPADGDSSSVRGGASAGLHTATSAKPLMTLAVALQSFIMRVRLPAEPLDKMLRPAYITSTAGVWICENRVQYVVRKGAKIRRGERIDVELRKFSTSSYDSTFETVLYTSYSDRIMRYADEGETTELCRCYVDLSPLPHFQRQARSIPSDGFYTDFELGFELDTPEVRGVLRYNGHDYGPIGFDLRS
ncbi:hypothetical protein BS47DRAFT_1374308 [Hydnum rufescens UP504]|uniref:Actin-like ATPase domain-containing protein n=1 Tax=Hydnum rufescens UP504 TaxID=1448309 RepID=A0A9P6AHH2_9AGAM|nr:hypothetical protein BS47DRAFT_1374308 [Hydnum rufescens UP504]